MQRFLAFLVEETLSGRASQLKEYAIGVSVFGKAGDFDPAINPVVRVEAGRLRRLLMQYRMDHGSADTILLEIPKGSYVPTFREARQSDDCGTLQTRAEAAADDREPSAEPTASKRSWFPSSQERRLVTVISCAFGDERNVSRQSTTDEFLSAYDTFHDKCTSVVKRYGGTVDGGASDRLIVYFGWPSALEDGAGRALTAALDMLASIKDAFAGRPLGIRIGVATSEVVARAGTEEPTRPPVVGEAPSMATKILPKVPINGILVAESTRRLTGSSFDLVPAGSLEDGGGDPDLLWRLLRAKPVLTRYRASHSGVQSPIIGRQEEVALLRSRWRLSVQGEGQGAVVVGEAGIGKSRLAEALLEQVARDGAQLRLQGSSHHTNSTLYPVVELIKSQLGLSADADDDRVDRRLDRFLARFELAESLDRALLCALLCRPGHEELASLSASQLKDLTLKLLARLLSAQVCRRPTMLLLEDIHWADPTTLELLQDVFRLAANSRLMVLATSREDPAPCFARQTNVTVLRLTRLSKEHCNELVDRTLATVPLSLVARSQILEKAEGIPLFLEELTKLFLAADENRLKGSPVPEGLSDLLASQLDRLGPTRGAAQVASVIGRQFTREMLLLASGFPKQVIDTALDQLLAAGVIVRHGPEPSDMFLFRHVLFRDAAYRSIPEHARRDWHYRLATQLIESFPEIAVEHPEVIGRHLMDGGGYDEAIPFWIEAGRKATGRYALAEAIADFRLGLAAVMALPDSPKRRERELDVLTELGLVIRTARGYGDQELLSIYQRARSLATELGKQEQLANAIYGLWTHAAGRGEWPAAEGLATEFEKLSGQIDDDQLEVEAHRLLGASAAFRGRFSIARHHFEQALASYDIGRHGPRFGFDPGAASAAYMSWVAWHLGQRDSAKRYAARAIEIAERKNHASTLAMVLSWLMFHEACEKDVAAIIEYNERLQVVCSERECRYWQPFGAACAEWAAFQRDGEPRHLDRLLESARLFDERYLTSCLLLLGADICIQLRRIEQGLELAATARKFVEDHDERVWEAECSRVTAELLLQTTGRNTHKARVLLLRAIKDVAPDERATEQSMLEEVIVTAERRSERSQDVPISMSVFSDDFIKQHISSPYEVANFTPNYQVNSVGGGFNMSTASIRGLGGSDAPGPVASSSILTYYDGLAADTPFGSTLPQWDLSRIEVQRGPQGTLYGRNAMGGAVQYFSAPPTDNFEGYGEVTLGEFDLKRFEGAVSGPITDTVQGRVSFLSFDRGGDMLNTTYGTKLNEREWYGVRGILDWQPTSQLTVRAKAQYFDADTDMIEPLVVPTDRIDPNQLAWLRAVGVDPELSTDTDFEQVQYGLRDPYNRLHVTLSELDVNYDFGPVGLTVIGGYIEGKDRFSNNPFAIPAPFTDQLNVSNLTQWSGEVRLTSQTEDPFKWIAGAYYQRTEDVIANFFDASALFRDQDGDGLTRYNADSPEDLLDGMIPLFAASNVFFNGGENQRDLETYALFAHTTYEWTERLKTTHAVRYTHESQDMNYIYANYMEFPVSSGITPGTLAEHDDFLRFASLSYGERRRQAVSIISDPNTFDANGNPVPFRLSDRWNVVTGRLAADYRLSSDAIAYSSVSRGFKGGRFTTLTNIGGELAADPETSVVYELGIKSDWLDKRLRVNASVFYNDHSDLQTNLGVVYPDGRIVSQLSNLPKVEIYGGELEVAAVPVKNLLVSANLGTLHSEITKVLPGNEALLGNEVPFAADLNFSGLVRYDMHTAAGTFSPQVSGRYLGKYYSTKENDNYKKLGGFWTMDVRLAYDAPGNKVYGLFYAANVLNERQVVSGGVPGLAGGNGSINDRRNWGVKVGYRF